MASPTDLTDPDIESSSLIEKPSVVQEGSLPVEISNSVVKKSLNLESAQDETKNLLDTEESEGRDQQLEPSIEENRNEEDDMDATQAANSSYSRRGGGPKRKKGLLKKLKQQEKSKEKLEILLKTLKPIPFVPGKTLDFSRHEKLLKTLGLWDFLHLEFDQNIRQDLVANLVAFYNPEGRCSYVNEARIKISRADLARALKLPKKKDVVITDEEKELFENDDSIRFIEEVLSTWILLQRDDMWIMPAEVVEWQRDIKQKQLEKLDWAALVWFMVEKELKSEPPLSDCFFASHLQMLIKSQKEDLFVDEDNNDDDDIDDVKEVEFLVKSPVKEEDICAADSSRGNGDVTESKEEKYEPKEEKYEPKEEKYEPKEEKYEPKEEKYVEEHMIELNLGQETVSEMVSEEEQVPVEEQEPMDVEEEEKWPCNEDIHTGSHFLRRCNTIEGDEENKTEGEMEIREDNPVEDIGEDEDEEDEEEHEGGFPFFPNGDSLHGVTQENLMLGDDASPLGYGSGLQIHGNSTGGDFLAGNSSLFGNGNNKREIDHGNDISYHSHSKRLRTEEPSWDEKPHPPEICLDQMSYWMEKTRLSFAEKDREREQSVMNQQYLMRELQNKEEIIQDLERSKFEEQQRKDLMIYRLESELRMMTSVVEGYRKALKETQKASREHRKRCPLRDEKPVYKDVKGSGGLVLSTNEIEKMRLKKEEEDKMMRGVIERQIEEIGSYWVRVFKEQMDMVEMMNERLIEVENEVKICRETVPGSKNHEISETLVAATEET